MYWIPTTLEKNCILFTESLFNLLTRMIKKIFAYFPKNQNLQKKISKCFSICIIILDTRNKKLAKIVTILKYKIWYEKCKTNSFLNVTY